MFFSANIFRPEKPKYAISFSILWFWTTLHFNIFTYFFINFRKKGKKSSCSTYKILKNFAWTHGFWFTIFYTVSLFARLSRKSSLLWINFEILWPIQYPCIFQDPTEQKPHKNLPQQHPTIKISHWTKPTHWAKPKSPIRPSKMSNREKTPNSSNYKHNMQF